MKQVKTSKRRNARSNQPTIWFKLTYSLQDMHLNRPRDAPIVVPIENDAELTLWIREPKSSTKASSQVCCDVVAGRALAPDTLAFFESIARRVLPQDDPPVVELPHRLSFDAEIDREGNVPGNYAIPASIMPRRFQSLSSDVKNSLRDIAHEFVTSLRWTQRVAGRHSAFAFINYQWSLDKQESVPSQHTPTNAASNRTITHRVGTS
jgi:hypothetical protein